MDALRKAEEAKKKAETADSGQSNAKEEEKEQEQEQQEQEKQEQQQERGAETGSDLPEQSESKTVSSPQPDPVPDTDFDLDPEPPTLIPNVEIEFQQAEEASEDANPEGSIEEDTAPSTAPSGLSLEPMDAGLSGATRKQFDQDVPPDYSKEAGATAASESKSKSNTVVPPPPATEETQHDDAGESAATDESIRAPGNVKMQEPEPAHAHDEFVVGESTDTAPKSSAKESVKAEASPPVKPRGGESGSERASSRSRTAPNPNLRSAPETNSVVARSAPDRRSARAVFAAKKQGKGRRLRIRRSTRIWAAQIAAVVLLMAGGAYLYLSINSEANSFNVPEQYLSNQASFSNAFNNELDAIEESLIEPEPSLDELAAVAEELLPEGVEFDDSNLGQQISDVVEEVTETVSAIIADDGVAIDAGATVASVVSVASVEPVTPEPDVIAVEAPADEAATDVSSADEQTLASNNVQQASNSFQSSQQASGPINFSRAQSVNEIDPTLQAAYVAYQRDDLARAQELYQQVVAESPLQRDALLGLAAIATRNGETSLAMELYSRLLARNPSDGVARAGLLGLRPIGGPEAQERELRRLLEDHPEVAPVVYALGNFYATQNRWNEAQRYYFNALQLAKTDALTGIPVNPDYAFNLAVSLERLRQPAAAENYYREAIAFAAEFPAGFDITIARNRLSRLTGRDS